MTQSSRRAQKTRANAKWQPLPSAHFGTGVLHFLLAAGESLRGLFRSEFESVCAECKPLHLEVLGPRILCGDALEGPGFWSCCPLPPTSANTSRKLIGRPMNRKA